MDKSEKFWDRSAKEYETKEIKWETIYNKAVEETKKYLNKNDILLEYACGAGVITAQIASCVKETHAIDISSKMLDVAKRMTDERKIENIAFLKTTIFDERFENESFDVITAFNILHLLEEVQPAIEKINELLKTDGLFISETPCLGEKGRFLGRILRFLSKLKILPYVNALKFSDLEAMIGKGNFEIVQADDLEQNRTNNFIVAKKIQS